MTKKQTTTWTTGAVIAMAVGGCGDWQPPEHGLSSIVFGVEQTKTSDGKLVTSAGYEMLTLGGHGSRARGAVDANRSCWSERLDRRLGQPRVEGGVASFKGARLPADGLVILANEPKDATFDGQAWATGDRLVFRADGFAMPSVGPYEIPAPSTELEVTKPDANAPLALRASSDLDVAWSPGAVTNEAVVAALTVGTEAVVRCFFDRAKGAGQIPHALLADLPDTSDGSPGTLIVATHRQLDAIAPGDWLVYVVATVQQRSQAFTLSR